MSPIWGIRLTVKRKYFYQQINSIYNQKNVTKLMNYELKKLLFEIGTPNSNCPVLQKFLERALSLLNHFVSCSSATYFLILDSVKKKFP